MKGIAVSPGIAIGRAYVKRSNRTAATGRLLENEAAVQSEKEKYRQAVVLSIGEVNELITQSPHSTGSTSGDNHGAGSELIEILETHIEWLGDPQIEGDVFQKITANKKNAHDAVLETICEVVQSFRQMKDEYMSARAADIQDIGNRLLRHLKEAPDSLTPEFAPATIIIAEDLTPSDTIAMDGDRVIGFATCVGGATSHAAIIARSRGIPAVVGCGEELKNIKDNDLLLLDGQAGLVIVNPDEDCIREYALKREAYRKTIESYRSQASAPAITLDGTEIKLLANISTVAELEQALEQGCEGVGLLRTEFLFLGRNSFPTEEEQFTFYKTIAQRAGNRPVTIRTLDIGGDKSAPYFGLPEEQNPFLGYRAIRVCLDRKDLFITQLKAILRASVFGACKVMFPMIGSIGELRSAKEILTTAKQELIKEGIGFDPAIPIGIMIEIPSAAITADLLAKEVDFFSIGTNDLVQYTLAVDRMNEKIKDLYDPFNPGVLRLIRYTIEQAHKNRIGIGMCGELASDPLATRLLIGMGLDNFSMTAASIPVIRNSILTISKTEAATVCSKVMAMDDSQAITNYLKGISSH